MSSLRPHTKMYPAEARKRLGLAVTRAREAAGYPYRPAFATAAGLSVRSIVNLEQGQPVGPSVYEGAARVLPNWDAETPRSVLEGADPPPVTDREDPPLDPLDRQLGGGGDELELVRLLLRRGWSPEMVADAIDELRRRDGVLPTVEPPSETDRPRNGHPFGRSGGAEAG